MMSFTKTTFVCLCVSLIVVRGFNQPNWERKFDSKAPFEFTDQEKNLDSAHPQLWQTLADVHSITIKKLTVCAKAEDKLVLKNPPSISPMTIKPGGTVEIHVLATLKENVTGGEIKMAVLFYQKSVDLCAALAVSGVVKCPVSAGTFNYVQTPLKFQVPGNLKIPITGEFNIKLTVSDSKGQELTCLGLDIVIN
uniref:MD-2-related lipid-recognition domain-containing protein n=1 Tax=Halisarca dujardinii TaxID=2583056 RepID=A0AA96MI30_HALDU|nr:uncharacterized protein [Halisarca dujardinii]